MLEYPGPPDNNDIRIISFDPGTDTFGCAILDINIDTLQPKVVWGSTLKASKLTPKTSTYADVMGGRAARIQILKVYIQDILINCTPTVMCAESPFLNAARVTSFEALVECYAMMKQAVYSYSRSIILHRIDPISAKNAVGVSHRGTDKEDVRNGVIAHLDGHLAPHLSWDDFDEHTIDAIAVGYSLFRQRILKDIIIRSKKAKKKRSAKVKDKDGVVIKPKRRKRRKRRRK